MARDVVIAPFERAHLDGVMALFATEGWSYAEDEGRCWRALSAAGSTSVVALVDDAVAGVAHVLSDGEIQAFLAVLLVAEAHRRKGIASRLIREAFVRAGAQRIDLVSCVDDFYESLGSRRVSAFRITREELGDGSSTAEEIV